MTKLLFFRPAEYAPMEIQPHDQNFIFADRDRPGLNPDGNTVPTPSLKSSWSHGPYPTFRPPIIEIQIRALFSGARATRAGHALNFHSV